MGESLELRTCWLFCRDISRLILSSANASLREAGKGWLSGTKKPALGWLSGFFGRKKLLPAVPVTQFLTMCSFVAAGRVRLRFFA